jgi:hypothetical protein
MLNNFAFTGGDTGSGQGWQRMGILRFYAIYGNFIKSKGDRMCFYGRPYEGGHGK